MSQNSEIQGLWYSLWPVSVSSPWAEAQHQFISSSTLGTLLLRLLDVHITFSPAPASSTKCLYSQIWIQSDHSTPFQQFQVPFPVSFDPWSAARLRSSLCVSCGSLCSGLVCSVPLAMAHYNESFSPWLRQSHDVAMWNEGHCLWPSTQSEHLFLSGDSLWNSAMVFYFRFLYTKCWSCLWMV